MSRELKLVMWCDGDHEGDVSATVARTISVDGGEPILLDLCETCDKVVQDVLLLMDTGVLAERAVMAPTTERRKPRLSQAQRTRAEATGRTRTDCLEDGCGYVAPTRTALGQHVRKAHGVGLSAYDWG